jgi:hypothetical protein
MKMSLKQLSKHLGLPPKWMRYQLHHGLSSVAQKIHTEDGTHWEIEVTEAVEKYLKDKYNQKLQDELYAL